MEVDDTCRQTVPLEAKSPVRDADPSRRRRAGDRRPNAHCKTGDLGFLHSFTTGSAVDGPGIRLVAWTTACMFRCQFCHNPDTWTLTNGIPVPLERAIDELRKYANGLKIDERAASPFRGGEPLMQDRFAARLFAAAKEMGVHTAIETNGFYGDRLSDEELEDIDLVILDMKAFSPEQHERVTRYRQRGRYRICSATVQRSSGRCGFATCLCPDLRMCRTR